MREEINKRLLNRPGSLLDRETVGKDFLDKQNPHAIFADMRTEVPTWPELKKDIRRLTARRGEKKALAEKCGVSRQVLGNWLSDDSQGTPNSELTLKLLKWVNGKK
jgi:DNA-binding phage protein